MKLRFVLTNGEIIDADRHIEEKYITHAINVYDEDTDNPTYDITILKDADILYRQYLGVNEEEMNDYLMMVKESLELEEECSESTCDGCTDCDCDQCDDTKPYVTSTCDDTRSYV